MPRINIKWSRLLSLKKDEIDKLENNRGGVYRLSKKEDGKYYVFFVGSTQDLKSDLLAYLSDTTNQIGQFVARNDCSFRYTLVEDKDTRVSIEKQLYKHYLPELNLEEPKSTLDIEANLN